MTRSELRQELSQTDDTHVVLGKLTSPYGVKGWLKVYSYTSPMDSILESRMVGAPGRNP